MKILYTALHYDYGDPKRGPSFEHTNFYETLIHMNHKIIYFPFDKIMAESGKEKMNQMLWDLVQKEKPDLLFTILVEDQLDKDIILKITNQTDTVTFNWFADDHWRFDNFSKYWVPMFNYVSTTSKRVLKKYAKIGYKNVIKTQWACNHYTYKKPRDLKLKHEVTFIGQPHSDRREIIDYLKSHSVKVETWGYGWKNGKISQQKMINVFATSKINLNLSAASALKGGIWGKGIRKLMPFTKNWEIWKTPDQIKGRNFEVPGCGGFLLSGQAENLEEYYKIGKEIEVYSSPQEMLEKIQYYLNNEKKRVKIAEAAYKRTIREHTYTKRFNEIFKKMGLI